jgi:hypothetical protein
LKTKLPATYFWQIRQTRSKNGQKTKELDVQTLKRFHGNDWQWLFIW